MNKQKCPKCGSFDLYQEVSVIAKCKVNGKQRIYDIDKNKIDNCFEVVYCSKCGWNDTNEVWKKATT